jgi:hypothetical protein
VVLHMIMPPFSWTLHHVYSYHALFLSGRMPYQTRKLQRLRVLYDLVGNVKLAQRNVAWIGVQFSSIKGTCYNMLYGSLRKPSCRSLGRAKKLSKKIRMLFLSILFMNLGSNRMRSGIGYIMNMELMLAHQLYVGYFASANGLENNLLY